MVFASPLSSAFTFAVQVNSLIQVETPDQLRGRTMSYYLLGILGGIAIGPLVMGAAIDAFGVRPTLFADAALVALVGLALMASGTLRVMDRPLVRPAPLAAITP